MLLSFLWLEFELRMAISGIRHDLERLELRVEELQESVERHGMEHRVLDKRIEGIDWRMDQHVAIGHPLNDFQDY